MRADSDGFRKYSWRRELAATKHLCVIPGHELHTTLKIKMETRSLERDVEQRPVCLARFPTSCASILTKGDIGILVVEL